MYLIDISKHETCNRYSMNHKWKHISNKQMMMCHAFTEQHHAFQHRWRLAL